MFHFFVILIFLCNFATAIDVPCPDASISASGVFPANATRLIVLPANYGCVQKFTIPLGFVVKFTVHAQFDINWDEPDIYVINAQGKTQKFTPGTSIFYVSAQSANLEIHTNNDNNQVHLQMIYEFIDVSTWKTTPMAAGSYTNLRIPANQTVTFSTYFDKIQLTSGSLLDIDPTPTQVLVYDGVSLMSPCLGSLQDSTVSSGNTVTLVNFYGSGSSSYVIANDYTEISKYSSYDLIVTGSLQRKATWKLKNFQKLPGAVTVISVDDGDNNFINDLKFGDSETGDNQVLDIYPMSPTHTKKSVLKYSNTIATQISMLMPQIIQTKMFTISLKNANVQIEMGPQFQQNWLLPYPGRQIIMFAPFFWGPNLSPACDFTFESNTTYQFTISVDSLSIAAAGESLHVAVGGTVAGNTVDQTYKCDSNQTSCVGGYPADTGVGTFAKFSYSGVNPGSSYFSRIVVQNVDSTTSTVPTSTTVGLETVSTTVPLSTTVGLQTSPTTVPTSLGTVGPQTTPTTTQTTTTKPQTTTSPAVGKLMMNAFLISLIFVM